MIALLSALLPAQADPVEPAKEDLSIALVDPALIVRYTEARAREGLPAEPLACESLWIGVAALCASSGEGERRHILTRAAMSAAGADLVSLRAQVAAGASVSGAESVAISGMTSSYLRLTGAERVSAVALRPDLLAERLGGLPIRVALPSDGLLVAWRVGPADLDRVMAIGVAELYAQLPSKLSSKIVTWDGLRWTSFGAAVPSTPPGEPPP